MSLREKQAVTRRAKMLDAAELLIRQSGGTDFSMRALAHIAEVSPATPYNFFGSKEGLLFALLSRNLTSFMDRGLRSESRDPIEQVLDAGDGAVTILLNDPVFLRPLYQVMLGLTDPLHHPKFLKDAFVFYRTSLNSVMAEKLIPTEAERSALACALMAHFMGVLDLWVHEDIDDDWFRAQIAYGFIRLLWPIAKGRSLTNLKKHHDQVRKLLSRPQLLPPLIR